MAFMASKYRRWARNANGASVFTDAPAYIGGGEEEEPEGILVVNRQVLVG
jgi:hypothetical protein